MTDGRIRVLSVDDHPLLREGIAAIINCQSDMSIVAAASNGKEAIEVFLRRETGYHPHGPQASGSQRCGCHDRDPDGIPGRARDLSTTFERDVEVQRALKAGARGYLLKSMPPKQMLETIRQVHAGKKSVPPEIAAGLAEHLCDEPSVSAKWKCCVMSRQAIETGISRQGCSSPRKPSRCT